MSQDFPQNFIERFRSALRIKTDWPSGLKADDASGIAEAETFLLRFQDFLVENYPAFHQNAERHVLSPYAVAYHWRGKADGGDAARKAKPALMLGHYDVVPAETAKWSTDPFGAELKDKFIYARGALDMKNMVVSMIEAAENLCKQGWRPTRDIWLVFGGDEERTGINGAKEMAKWFSEKGIQFSFTLDEGTPVAVDQIKGVNKPLALIGIEEKGFLSLDLTVSQSPGHASQPPEHQAAAILARALTRLSRRPFPWHLTPTVEAFFKKLGIHAPGITGFFMKHARLLGPLFFKAAAGTPATRALLRTTLAMTQLEGSAAENVLPSTVRAVINLRLLPPWTVDTVINRVRTVIADDRVTVAEHSPGTNPVEAGPDQALEKSPGWKEIKAAIGKTFPDLPILPFLMLATTDSRHYQKLSPFIFRFNPLVLNPAELSLIHGHDERISIENLEYCLKFYEALMQEL